jgi:hypothetical protein
MSLSTQNSMTVVNLNMITSCPNYLEIEQIPNNQPFLIWGSEFEFIGMNPECLLANTRSPKEYEYFVFDSQFESGNLDLAIKVRSIFLIFNIDKRR